MAKWVLAAALARRRAFFDGMEAAPSQAEEIDALMAETSAWYEAQLKAIYPNLDSFQATLVNSVVDLNAANPIEIDFDANAFFMQGKLALSS